MSISFSGNVSPAQQVQTGKNQNVAVKNSYQRIATGEEKPKFTKAYGNGFLQKLATTVPILGTYLIGKRIIEQDNQQEALAKGVKNESEGPGFFKSFFKGLGMKLSLVVPFYGAYRVGKEIIEQKNIQEALATGNNEKATEKPKFWQSWWEGTKMALSQLVPVYGTYKLGKNVATHKAIDRMV